MTGWDEPHGTLRKTLLANQLNLPDKVSRQDSDVRTVEAPGNEIMLVV